MLRIKAVVFELNNQDLKPFYEVRKPVSFSLETDRNMEAVFVNFKSRVFIIDNKRTDINDTCRK